MSRFTINLDDETLAGLDRLALLTGKTRNVLAGAFIMAAIMRADRFLADFGATAIADAVVEKIEKRVNAYYEEGDGA